MRNFIKSIASFYLTLRFFLALGLIVLLFLVSYFFTWLYIPVFFCLFILFILTIIETTRLYSKNTIEIRRVTAAKWSNGDQNPVFLSISSHYRFPVKAEIYDELPLPLQIRDFKKTVSVAAGSFSHFSYACRPVSRGEYTFGNCNVLVSALLGLVQRRYILREETTVAVYPSYLSMQRYEYLAITNRLQEAGIKKLRKIGHQYEFEQIRDYVAGDDYRTLNWKATARRGKLMVNQFQDERSQQVYCLIDKGRVMKSPFEGMTLLDYAINASLVLSNIAIRKYDKAGLITFDEKQVQFLNAEKKSGHMARIQQMLYDQQTTFLESDYERLYIEIRRKIPQRSLLILFTNFDTVTSMERQLPYFKALNRNHLLLVVFFKNTETDSLAERKIESIEDVYLKTIAEKFRFEKEEIVTSLRKQGILSLLSAPSEVTAETLNKYIELKARGAV